MNSGPSIVFMGTPHFAVEPLKAIIKGGYNVSAVVTVPDKPAGRGLNLSQSPVKVFAQENGLRMLQPEKLRSEDFINEFVRIAPDIIVVIAFRMLPESVWSIAKLGTFNLHASLLPQYRGAAPINWAIINGERQTGITTFLIDNQIDTGSVLFQEATDIKPNETAGELHDRLMEMGGSLVIKTIDALYKGGFEALPQSQLLGIGQYVKMAPKIFKETCQIDWTKPAQEVHNHIRGLSPYPGAWSRVALPDGSQTTAKILMSQLAEGNSLNPENCPLLVPCGIGAVCINQIQLAGKKTMPAADFLRGLRGNGTLTFS